MEPRRRGRPPDALNPDDSSAARLGFEIRSRREGQGLTLGMFADRIGFSPQHVSEVERAKASASRPFVAACDRALGARGVLIDLLPAVVFERASERHDRSARRRRARASTPHGKSEPLAAAFPAGPRVAARSAAEPSSLGVSPQRATGAGLDAQPQAGLDDAHEDRIVDGSDEGLLAVGAADVQLLLDARNHYELMYRRAGGLVTRPRLVGFLKKQTTPLLSDSNSPRTQRQLHRGAAALVALAGICAYDAEHHGLALRDFQQALRLARSSRDTGFGGYVLGLMINQALALGDLRGAVRLAEVAIRSAGRDMSPALVADVRGMQAQAYAQLGDARATRVAMDQAEVAASRILPGQGPAEANYVQPGLVESRLTEALLSLGDLGPAQRYAHQMLQGDVHPRGRVNRLATTATLALRSGDADRAAALAIEMIERAQGIESRRLYGRFRNVRRALADSDASLTTEVVP